MKIIFKILIFISIITNTCKAQAYVSVSPSISATTGTMRDKLGAAVEIGQQWGKLGIGFDIGKTCFSKIGTKDTTTYYEWRPFYTVYQSGSISHVITLGYGKIFQAVQDNMFEINYGLEMNLSKKIDYITFFVGSYYLWGSGVSGSSPFAGITLTKSLKRK